MEAAKFKNLMWWADETVKSCSFGLLTNIIQQLALSDMRDAITRDDIKNIVGEELKAQALDDAKAKLDACVQYFNGYTRPISQAELADTRNHLRDKIDGDLLISINQFKSAAYNSSGKLRAPQVLPNLISAMRLYQMYGMEEAVLTTIVDGYAAGKPRWKAIQQQLSSFVGTLKSWDIDTTYWFNENSHAELIPNCYWNWNNWQYGYNWTMVRFRGPDGQFDPAVWYDSWGNWSQWWFNPWDEWFHRYEGDKVNRRKPEFLTNWWNKTLGGHNHLDNIIQDLTNISTWSLNAKYQNGSVFYGQNDGFQFSCSDFCRMTAPIQLGFINDVALDCTTTYYCLDNSSPFDGMVCYAFWEKDGNFDFFNNDRKVVNQWLLPYTRPGAGFRFNVNFSSRGDLSANNTTRIFLWNSNLRSTYFINGVRTIYFGGPSNNG